ncbi:flagellar biosynthesis anti-sigma factor FlgM [Modicisalibacter tunisiensis]|uniref:Negative regulator of flagellin synthesis n=1 Tax=Modicisalibacter tunisiensis TaxID=390637 RepID=A0ABS7X1H6_9GAMM|nr:flagellar biosynthesis anti-sigma factor FlgM [Modicisalibacter tunisiensis]MBZ9568259.1 flagellar biosynthesis anti-sigma factor FlgM [Modicisalibacter tunisiensis]
MKIDGSHPLQRPTQSDATRTGKPSRAEDGNTQGTNATSVAHLSDRTQDATRDIDTARVAEVRQAISEGRLEIRPERIADGLIQSVRDLLD